jgi:hypothetical protein
MKVIQLHLRRSLLTWNKKLHITNHKLLHSLILEIQQLKPWLKQKLKWELLHQILLTMRRVSMMSNKQDNNNTKHGLERMRNMLIKLMLLMRHQRSFNIYKQVLHLLNLRVDLRKFNQNSWNQSMLYLSPLLMHWHNWHQRLIIRVLLKSWNFWLKLDNN